MYADPPPVPTATAANTATASVPTRPGSNAPEPGTAVDIAITTPRLRLRPLRLADALAVYEYTGDPVVARHILSPVHHTPVDTHNLLSYWIACAERAPYEFVMLGVELRETERWQLAGNPGEIDPSTRRRDAVAPSGAVIGDVSVRRSSYDAPEAEIGYTLHRALWGRGFATEAATAIIAWAFARWDIATVCARCDPANRPSIAVMKRLGMRKRERVRRGYHKNGRWRPSVAWAVNREQWTATRR